MKYGFPLVAILLVLNTYSLASNSVSLKEFESMSLEELMDIKISVATKNESSLRESPGIVTILTREEIQASGARDMIDILRLVPGFDFGLDGWVPVGPSFRGIWGAEGRILMLWDGIIMNEMSAGTIHFGNRYPIDQIKRIEIIRGPGSVIYGGNAEVAVISVTTLKAEDIKGIGIGATYGRGTKDTLRSHGHLTIGKVWKSLKLAGGLFVGKGQRTDQNDYDSSTGQKLDYKDNWNLNPFFLNLALTGENFESRILWDVYQMSQAVDYGSSNLDSPQKQRFENMSGEIRYNIKTGEKSTLTPFISHQRQKPWWVDSGPFIENKYFFRDTVGATWNLKASSAWNFLSGLEITEESAKMVEGESTFPNGKQEVSYTNKVMYGQAEYSGPVTATIGIRAEDHSSYGSFNVPRFALTKIIGPWHYKALYAKAFRSPGISNIELGVDPKKIKPEKTTTVEFEIGRQVGRGLLSLNLFDTKIEKPLVYLGDESKYQNQSETGSYGAEIEYKYRPNWGFLNSSLSYYTANNKANFYSAPDQSDYSLSAPRLKGSVAAGWKINDNWILGPSIIYLGKRYAFDWIEKEETADYKFFEPVFLLNLNIEYKIRDWTTSLALLDIMDENPHFLQNYQGGQPSVPGASREILLKVRHGF